MEEKMNTCNSDCTCCDRKKERDEKEYKDLMNRLSRIEGQIRGIKGMVEKDCYCPDIITQVAAANAALNSFNKALLAEHIGICRRGTAEEIAGIAGRYNTFPALPPRKALLEAMSHDKKFSGGRRVFALPERIGSVVLREVGFGELCSFLDKLYM